MKRVLTGITVVLAVLLGVAALSGTASATTAGCASESSQCRKAEPTSPLDSLGRCSLQGIQGASVQATDCMPAGDPTNQVNSCIMESIASTGDVTDAYGYGKMAGNQPMYGATGDAVNYLNC